MHQYYCTTKKAVGRVRRSVLHAGGAAEHHGGRPRRVGAMMAMMGWHTVVYAVDGGSALHGQKRW